jgi:hypothetical protein
MSKHSLFWLVSVLLGLSQGIAQAQSTQDKASRLALEVEWVRSPRAVIDIGTATQRPQRSEKGSPFSEPVEVEAYMANDQEPKVWSLGPQDKKLSLALMRWAQQAGWQIVWEADRDFTIESSLHLSGDFIKSVGAVMQSLATSDYPLQAKANRSTLTLRISRYQDAGNR